MLYILKECFCNKPQVFYCFAQLVLNCFGRKAQLLCNLFYRHSIMAAALEYEPAFFRKLFYAAVHRFQHLLIMHGIFYKPFVRNGVLYRPAIFTLMLLLF